MDDAEALDNAVATLRKSRVSAPLRRAISLITTEGKTVDAAAQAVGLKPESLRKALKKPHVAAVVAGVKRAWLASETSASWVRVAGLAASAVSEDVRLKANRLILEAAGELSGDSNPQGGGARTLVQIVLQSDAGQRVTADYVERLPGVVERAPPAAQFRDQGPDSVSPADPAQASGLWSGRSVAT